MKLTVVMDNQTLIDQYYCGEPGLSFYIEEEGLKILFDVGYSHLFIRNCEQMKIDLSDLNFIVLSHGHLDHTWGLPHLIQYLNNRSVQTFPKLIGHPHAFFPKFIDQKEIGSILPAEQLAHFFTIQKQEKPLWINESLVFLGPIPRKNNFEAQYSIGKTQVDGSIIDDYLLDDTALAYKSQKGLVVITGCAHAGICNTIQYAMEVCCENRIQSVIGGLHLQNPSCHQMNDTLSYLHQVKVKKLYPCHCTDLHSKIALAKICKIYDVGVGLSISFN